MATPPMAMAMAIGGGGLCCSPSDRCCRHYVFRSDPSPPPHQSLPRLILGATDEYALSFSSTTLTCTALPSPPTSGRPRMAMERGIRMRSSLEEERRESLGQEARIERLWKQFFRDPSQWWDKRFDKGSTEAPDFEHKTTGKALWMNDRFRPPWLQAKLATLDSKQYALNLHTCQPLLKRTQLWEEFFSDPSQWWDIRSDKKKNPKFPDFTHKTRKEALWIENRLNPPWVHAKLAAMVQCQEQGQSGFSTPEVSGRVVRMEQLWREFFSDPSQWWDNRFTKKSPKYPDFTHKSKLEGLWVDGWLNPSWVKAKIATMALDHIQSSGGLRSRVPNCFCNGDKVRKLCQEGRLKEALHMVKLMVQQTIKAPIGVYVCLLKGCARGKALEEGKQVHALIVDSKLDSNIFLANNLVDMYSKCGSLSDAHNVFSTMPRRNVFSWTAIISAYADSGQGVEAINLFQQMQETGIAPDKVAFVVVLKVCARITALEQGKQLHSDVIRRGFESDLIVANTLVDMYAKCGCTEDARELFNNMSERDVVSWNVMIAGYAQNGLVKEALALYKQMKQEGVQPDNVTFVVLLKACASIASLEQGKQLHSNIITRGFESDVIVRSTLIDMYAKCGCLEDARELFNNMSERNVVLWTVMIAGYAQNGLGKEALALYEQMQQEGVQPNNVTFVVLINACASIASLEQGKQLHAHIIKRGFESDVIVRRTLVDMYAKCGCTNEARELFNNTNERDVISWNMMIAGYAQNGLGKEALALYEQMKLEGVKPNNATYNCLLSACSHSGLVDEGRHLFDSMCKNLGVTPTLEHYSCMVDLFGRAGCLADAEDFIIKLPIQPDTVIWMTLLGAARNYGHVEIGRRAFDCILKLEPENASAYVLLSKIYATAGRMDEVAKLRKKMKAIGVSAGVQLD